MLVELAGLPSTAVYHLMTQVIVPRPIAWVVSDNGAGDDRSRWNVAPYSYFNAVASDPPTVMFSVGVSTRGSTGSRDVKDTLANVSLRPEHTIALPNRGQLEAVEATAAPAPSGVSEFDIASLEPVAWDWPVPMPSGVRAALGCTVDRIVPVAEGPQRVVLARVHRLWVDDAVTDEDEKGRSRIDPVLLDPLLRLGAGQYAAMGEPARPGRPVHLPT